MINKCTKKHFLYIFLCSIIMTNNKEDLSDKNVIQNREIRFELLDQATKQTHWYEFLENWERENRGKNESSCIYWNWVCLREYIRRQYTWLKDKNWIEIYDWDIVYFDEYSKSGIVVYLKAKYMIKRLDKNRPRYVPEYTELSYREHEISVTWNIYQNPELLSE